MMWRLFALLLLSAAAFADEPHPTLAIGSSAPDFALPGIDGKIHKLSDYAGSKVLVIVFTCNHCPTAQLYEPRIKKLAADYASKGVALVAIQPNNPTRSVWTSSATPMSATVGRNENSCCLPSFQFPIPLRRRNPNGIARIRAESDSARVYLRPQRKLRYEGRVDNNQRESLVKTQERVTRLTRIGRKARASHPYRRIRLLNEVDFKQASRAAEMKKIEAEPVGAGHGVRGRSEKTALQYHRQSAAGQFLGDLVWSMPPRVSRPRNHVSHVPAA